MQLILEIEEHLSNDFQFQEGIYVENVQKQCYYSVTRKLTCGANVHFAWFSAPSHYLTNVMFQCTVGFH